MGLLQISPIEVTLNQYDSVTEEAKNLFVKKHKDYGSSSWTILRMKSVTDQIQIKAKRIATIEENGSQLVNDSIHDEYIGILNYCVIALLKWNYYRQISPDLVMVDDDLIKNYDSVITECKNLMRKKNTDYGEAWRDMRISSLTDMILVKTYRIKNIEDKQYKLETSENVQFIYMDILNYSIFSLIRLKELNGAEKH